jgi:hypothetical protein
MESVQAIQRPGPLPVQGGWFSWRDIVLATIGGAAAGLIWAWIAFVWQSYAAPVIVFPILLGILTGLTVIGLTRFLQIGHRPTIMAATILAAVAAVFGQYYFRGLLAGKPIAVFWSGWVGKGFGLRALDSLLTLAAAVVVTIPAIRVSYCNRCKTWYRTVRNGKIDVATARRLAETCSVEGIENFHSPRYRLSCCRGGCSPTCCELTWEDSSGTVELARVWLGGEKRNHVATILDALAKEAYSED